MKQRLCIIMRIPVRVWLHSVHTCHEIQGRRSIAHSAALWHTLFRGDIYCSAVAEPTARAPILLSSWIVLRFECESGDSVKCNLFRCPLFVTAEFNESPPMVPQKRSHRKHVCTVKISQMCSRYSLSHGILQLLISCKCYLLLPQPCRMRWGIQ